MGHFSEWASRCVIVFRLGVGEVSDVLRRLRTTCFVLIIYIHYSPVQIRLCNLADMLGCQTAALLSTKQIIIAAEYIKFDPIDVISISCNS